MTQDPAEGQTFGALFVLIRDSHEYLTDPTGFPEQADLIRGVKQRRAEYDPCVLLVYMLICVCSVYEKAWQRWK